MSQKVSSISILSSQISKSSIRDALSKSFRFSISCPYSVRISHSDREFQLRAKDEQNAKEWIKEIKIHIEEANRLRAGEGSPTDLVKDTKFWKVKTLQKSRIDIRLVRCDIGAAIYPNIRHR